MIQDLKTQLRARFNIDLDAALKALGIPQNTYERILRLSMSSTGDILATIDAALARNDLAAVQRSAHELKGVYANMRIAPLQAAAQGMNDMARTGASDEVRRYLNDFRRDLSTLKELLGPGV